MCQIEINGENRNGSERAAKVMVCSNIRYLNQREKQASRTLYEAAFPEDSKEFTDYYYEWKIIDNEVIVMEGAVKDSSFHVMIHLNPYRLWVNGSIREVPYIVAVATDERHRRQGKMGQVMGRALQDMEYKQIPFTFLLPADPAYYRGQGFSFFPCQDYLQRGGICFAQSDRENLLRAASFDVSANDRYKAGWKRASEEDFEEMAAFSNRVLADRCEVFIWRDRNYYYRLLKELASEHGGALLLKESGLCGILLYSISSAEENLVEVKELLLMDSVSREEAEQICCDALKEAECAANKIRFHSSRMMVRLTNLRALAPLLRSERPTVLSVKVIDPLIKENNGCFLIETDSTGGSISEISEESARQQMDIAKLAQILFQHTSVYLNEWV